MWLFKSSVGRKVVMSISGLFLIVFLCVHLAANSFMYASPEAFGVACAFMGSPIVSAMVPVLLLGFGFHIIYAFILNARNLKARGREAYKGGSKTPINPAAKNMLILGIIVLGGLAFHLTQFWAEMQMQMLLHREEFPMLAGLEIPELMKPYILAKIYFSNVINSIIYIVWICALWCHLTHGFWSAFQTLGINNRVWYHRWHVIGIIISTIICLGFISIPLSFLMGILA